jgi:enamidase
MVTMTHTGGSSIPGSSGIWADHLLKINPDVSYHVNGGPVAMPDADYPRLINESSMALPPAAIRKVRVSQCRLPMNFGAA